MLSPEELLKPRYKVIADYPHSGHNVGEIIHVDSLPLPRTGVEMFNKYPHLFRKLQWWEERKPEDMPQYVKKSYSPFEVLKPDRYHKSNEIFFHEIDGEDEYENLHYWLPAAETEYNEYNLKLKTNE